MEKIGTKGIKTKNFIFFANSRIENAFQQEFLRNFAFD